MYFRGPVRNSAWAHSASTYGCPANWSCARFRKARPPARYCACVFELALPPFPECYYSTVIPDYSTFLQGAIGAASAPARRAGNADPEPRNTSPRLRNRVTRRGNFVTSPQCSSGAVTTRHDVHGAPSRPASAVEAVREVHGAGGWIASPGRLGCGASEQLVQPLVDAVSDGTPPASNLCPAGGGGEALAPDLEQGHR